MDAAFIKECADPSLKPAIVEQFVELAGSPDPLSITVKSGGRLILVPKPKTTDDAMAIIKANIGSATVRVGLTQFPAGVGIEQVDDLKPSLMDACGNVRAGTTMFAKVLRIVAKWYGNPGDKVFPQIFDDAIYAWKTGNFEGTNVFQAEDPGGRTISDGGHGAEKPEEQVVSPDDGATSTQTAEQSKEDLGKAEMRIDLTRIGGSK